MRPYGFDRAADGQFLRAPDYQRNAGRLEGQVIAQHLYIGHPPFQSSQRHSASETSTSTADESAWMNSIESWLYDGLPNSSPDPDYDDLSGQRYLSVEFSAIVGSTTCYHRKLTCGKHTQLTGIFHGSGEIVGDDFYSYNTDPEINEWYHYQYSLLDDGTYDPPGNHAYYTGGTMESPIQTVNRTLGDWPGEGWEETGWERTVAVSAIGAFSMTTLFSRNMGDHSQTSSTTILFSFTLSDAWSFNQFQQQLDDMLAKVNLDDTAQRYPIKDDPERQPGRLKSQGESITVTMEGPRLPDGSAIGVRTVFTSNGEWNWSTNGPCAVAENWNDIVKAAGEDGVADPSGVVRGGVWEMIKSNVLLPSRDYLNRIKHYRAPEPDTASWTLPSGGTPDNHGWGTHLNVNDAVTTIQGTGILKAFPRGEWITLTRLVALDID